MQRPHVSAQARLLIESGVLLGLLSFSIWLGVNVQKVEAHELAINRLREDQNVLSRDLVDTQKKMIRSLTRIEGRLNIREDKDE